MLPILSKIAPNVLFFKLNSLVSDVPFSKAVLDISCNSVKRSVFEESSPTILADLAELIP